MSENATLYICTTCRAGAGGEERPGEILLRAVQAAPAMPGVTVAAVECLSVCKRPCTVALAGPGKWTYVVADLDPVAHLEDVLTATRLYAVTLDGIVPWRARPQIFRKSVVARVPPLRLPPDQAE